MPAVHLILTDEPSSTANLRRVVDSMARARGLSPEARFDLKLAATEAVANALRHGSPDGRAVGIALEERDGAIELEVQDQGRLGNGRAYDGERGRGIPLMLAVADEVEFASTDQGTRVRIRKRVSCEGPGEQLPA